VSATVARLLSESSRSGSLVLERSAKPGMLFSRLPAAVSRSGHSERFTNWYCGSVKSVSTASVLLDMSDGSVDIISSEGTGAVSLKSCKVAATLRPVWCVGGAW
jgi:hypothetical protein